MLEANLSTIKSCKSTQAHHAIPVNSYWTSDAPYDRKEASKLSEADETNFEVNLLYRDHLLIHSYLTMCTDLENVQRRYEAQAELRKRNGYLGAAAVNHNLQRQITGKYATAHVAYIQQHYSAEETEEILNL
jgi:hypothetical protein